MKRRLRYFLLLLNVIIILFAVSCKTSYNHAGGNNAKYKHHNTKGVKHTSVESYAADSKSRMKGKKSVAKPNKVAPITNSKEKRGVKKVVVH